MRLPSKQENNRAAVFLVGAVGGIGGSAVSAILVVSAVWAAIRLVFRSLPFVIARNDLVLLAAVTIYVVINTVAALANGMMVADLAVFYPIFTFLFPWLLISRMRLSPPGDLILTLALGASLCGIFALPLALYQELVLEMRAEGGAGNALPFAFVCSLAGQFALLNLLQHNRFHKILGIVGYVAAFACVLLSQSKGLLPVMFIGPTLMVILFPALRTMVFSLRGLVVLVIAVAVLAPFSAPVIARVDVAVDTLISGDMSGDASTSERLLLWEKAWELFEESPVLGHGMQNRQTLIAETGIRYGHFHSGYVTAAVDAGSLGLVALLLLLAAPVLTALRARRTEFYAERLYLALALSGAYALAGLTNVMLWHDIYASMFEWCVVLIAASVPLSADNPPVWSKGV